MGELARELGNIRRLLGQNLLLFEGVSSSISSDARNEMIAACADAFDKTKPPLPGDGEDFGQ